MNLASIPVMLSPDTTELIASHYFDIQGVRFYIWSYENTLSNLGEVFVDSYTIWNIPEDYSDWRNKVYHTKDGSYDFSPIIRAKALVDLTDILSHGITLDTLNSL